jgi:hypothetical protein
MLRDFRYAARTYGWLLGCLRKSKDLTQRAQQNGGEHAEGGRDPSAGMRQSRRPQDDDVRRIVRDAEDAEKTNEHSLGESHHELSRGGGARDSY